MINPSVASVQSTVKRSRHPFPKPEEDPRHPWRCRRWSNRRFPRGGSQLPLSLSRFMEKGREMGDARRLSPWKGLYPPRGRVGRRAVDFPAQDPLNRTRRRLPPCAHFRWRKSWHHRPTWQWHRDEGESAQRLPNRAHMPGMRDTTVGPRGVGAWGVLMGQTACRCPIRVSSLFSFIFSFLLF
jgi:hypothetical protein